MLDGVERQVELGDHAVFLEHRQDALHPVVRAVVEGDDHRPRGESRPPVPVVGQVARQDRRVAVVPEPVELGRERLRQRVVGRELRALGLRQRGVVGGQRLDAVVVEDRDHAGRDRPLVEGDEAVRGFGLGAGVRRRRRRWHGQRRRGPARWSGRGAHRSAPRRRRSTAAAMTVRVSRSGCTRQRRSGRSRRRRRGWPASASRASSMSVPVAEGLGRYPSRPMATTERDFYVILGVERTATDAQIKAAFRKLAQTVASGRQPGSRGARSASRRSTRPTRSCPTRNGARATTPSDEPASTVGRVDPAAPGSRASVASRTSSTRSSVAVLARHPPGVAGRSPAPTSATTSGSPSRRPSRAPRRRSSSPSWAPARRAAATARNPAPSRSPARPATAAVRCAPSARRCSARWSTSTPARAATARARSSRRRATPAKATAGPNASGRCACRSRPASTRATRSACRTRARSGRAAGRRAACTSPCTSCRTRR